MDREQERRIDEQEHQDQQHQRQDQELQDQQQQQQQQQQREPLNVRIRHSLGETINHVKEAVVGNGGANAGGEPQESPRGASILQSMEDKIVNSMHSVEETLAHSVQTMKEAASAAAEAAVSPASGTGTGTAVNESPLAVSEEDEAAVLMNAMTE